ncbi:protein YgfX [Chitinimonas lacunae]|uniref:Protein YgfX n=1 Tax=Chitinimonas lacunae TaxID=1963018 RepID=A0ABV8MM19_9NEIS
MRPGPPAQRLQLRPSRRQDMAAALLRMAALLAPWAAGLAPEYGALTALLLYGESRRQPAFPVRLEFEPDGRLQLGDAATLHAVEHYRPLLCTRWLVVLALRLPGAPQRLWLWPDSLSADDWRRLRARLAWSITDVSSSQQISR